MNARIQQRVQLAIFFLLFHFLVNRSPSQFWSLFFTFVCLESRSPLIPIQPVSSPWFKFPLQFSFKVNSPSLFCPLTLLWYSVIGFHTHGQVSTSGHCSSARHLCRLSYLFWSAKLSVIAMPSVYDPYDLLYSILNEKHHSYHNSLNP